MTESRKNRLSLFPTGEKGEVLARDYRDGSTWQIRWDATGLLERVPTAPDGEGRLWVAPGLFDLQVNGYAGIDFQSPCDAGQLHQAAEGLQKSGCTRALLTLITCPWDDLLAKVASLRKILRSDAQLDRVFPGWHIEGPFLSEQPGFHGAHNPLWMRNPCADDILRLKEVVGDDPLLLTMAPERPQVEEAVRQAVDCGFVVSFGHTNASAAELHASVRAGGRAFTHLGNGCTQMLDRHDNILWRVLDEEALVAGLIPDGVHVSPALFRLLHRALDPSRIYWTTDAMSAAGAPEGKYFIGELEIEVGPDRIARNCHGGFAGSTLEPLEGIRRGAAMLDRRWQDVWDFLSVRPARLMNLPGELGSPAGFCLLQQD